MVNENFRFNGSWNFFLEWINKVFYRFYCLPQNIHVPCRISLAIKTVLKFIGQQKVYVTCVHMHLFRVVNQMSLIKDLKFTTTTPHPPLDFSMTQNKCQMHRRCTLEAQRFIVVFVFDFFPSLSLFDRGLRKKFSDILKTFAD